MKVLVCAASKYGATSEIAQAVADVLAERSAAALAARPVWLFSSGPVGEPAKPADNPVDVTKVLEDTGARDHQIFTGQVVRKDLSFPDRAVVSALRVQEGDFR